MTEAADLVLRNGRVRTLAGDAAEAVAARDGRIVSVGRTSELDFLVGVETTVVDLDGRVVLPGFVDAHTHMDLLGKQQVEADLSGATSPDECLDRLADRRAETDGWVLGFGYDESRWDGGYLTRDHLDDVSTDRPVVAYREDLHLASVNSVVLDRLGEEFPDEYVETESGTATGVLREDALSVLREAIDPGPERIREYLLTAQEYAHRHGVTSVHDIVRDPAVARTYRELDRTGELTVRVRLNYLAENLDAVREAGLVTNHGTEHLRTGAIKAFADGSFGSRTARLSEPYADGEGRGEWTTPPEELAALVERVDDADMQAMIHAIGDEAVDAVVDAYAEADRRRHRIEHAELLSEESIRTAAEEGVVVSAQPNFLKWARDDGLYDKRLGEQRRRRSNPFGRLREADVPLAFGSDCMPMDPLFGIAQATTAPEKRQRLDTTEAVRAYTLGGAYAGFAEDRLGSIEPEKYADFVVLDGSPWEYTDPAEIAVEMTVVGGTIVSE
ncbi:amidohydrolase family protein [Halovenus sp. WSH3]|uniref:Amidohydrolase family protein n=1 Tax=Halovenus carboxidivorans TaxID=2692199 RepID=A0A6B0T5S8_9EURY|nr:amidohydrolase [Halovenus carboxidivorans]MXR50581.1 amidohydrolase family protein [Halovenus carboxidivorans]